VGWLDPLLLEHGVTHTCIELTGERGIGAVAHLAPIQARDGPVLVPIDRATIDLVWGGNGYPARAAYRDRHRLTAHHHRVRANDGSPYDRDRAAAQARADAGEFVEAVQARLAAAGGGLCVCALDTELLGHWWFEGPRWLDEVIRAARRRGLAMTALDHDTVTRHVRGTATATRATSWGEGNDLRTWSSPAVADLAFAARTAELETLTRRLPPPRALRELMALQASDWAFMAGRGWAGEYPRQRANGHAARLRAALGPGGGGLEPWLRNLAPDL
jgi:1,4-alpha-glucan branching enzyme